MPPNLPHVVARLRAKYRGYLIILRGSPVSLVYPPDLELPIPADAKVVDGLIDSRMRNGWPLLIVEDVGD
jgi:hypothetical protein